MITGRNFKDALRATLLAVIAAVIGAISTFVIFSGALVGGYLAGLAFACFIAAFVGAYDPAITSDRTTIVVSYLAGAVAFLALIAPITSNLFLASIIALLAAVLCGDRARARWRR